MCPDESLLSAYVDGEVPSPWKENMESHFRECPVCTGRIAEFRRLDSDIQALQTADLDSSLAAAQKRIAADLDFGLADSGRSTNRSIRAIRREGESRVRQAMSRRISVPAPLLAASFVIIIFLAGILLGGNVLSGRKPQSMASASGTIQAGSSSMESINKYWTSQKSDQGVTITMPSEVSFEPIGDPVIMTYEDKAATVSTQDAGQGGQVP